MSVSRLRLIGAVHFTRPQGQDTLAFSTTLLSCSLRQLLITLQEMSPPSGLRLRKVAQIATLQDLRASRSLTSSGVSSSSLSPVPDGLDSWAMAGTAEQP